VSSIRLALAAGAASAAVSIFAAPALAAPRFVVPDMSPSGGYLPRDLAVADFTGDGKDDVAAANLGPDAFNGNVSVLANDGAGNLGDPTITSLGAQNGAAELSSAVDFDKDGKRDLAVLTGTTGGFGSIAVLLGNGDGTFTPGPQLAGGDGHVEAGDVTNDGKADVIFAFKSSALVRVYRGRGDGTFRPPVDYDVNWGSYDIELGDLDGDGDLDLAGAAGGPIWTMVNNGGTFGPQTASAGLSGWKLTLADFNLDGKLDVADVNASGGAVETGLGDGSTFTLAATYQDVAHQTQDVEAADWSGDGKPDLLVNADGFTPTTVSVLMRGVGDGTFNRFTYWATGNRSPLPANLDGGGRLDLVAFSEGPGLVYATLGAATGFRAPKLEPTVQLGAAADGDVDGDGDPDLVMLGVFLPRPGVLKAQAVVHLNQGNGAFGKAVTSSAGKVDTGEGPSMIVLGDVNEDGKLDIVAGIVHLFPQATNVWVMLGQGDGHFGAPKKYGTGEVHASNQSIAVADVTGDGHLDIVGHTIADGWQLAVLPGNGDGTFGAPIASGSSDPTQPDTLVADFTGDGKLDVVAVIKTGGEDFGGGDLRLEKGNGDGTFTLIQTRSFDGNPGDGEVADFNGDGKPDVAVTGTRGSNGGRTGTWIGLNAGGTLAPLVYYPSPWGAIDVADLDLDGDVDVVGSGLDGLLTIRLNDGTGAFPSTFEMISTAPGDILARDWTGDGKPDVLVLGTGFRPLFGLYRNAK